MLLCEWKATVELYIDEEEIEWKSAWKGVIKMLYVLNVEINLYQIIWTSGHFGHLTYHYLYFMWGGEGWHNYYGIYQFFGLWQRGLEQERIYQAFEITFQEVHCMYS